MKHKLNRKDWLKVLKYLFLYDFYRMAFKSRVKRMARLYGVGFITKEEFDMTYRIIERKLHSHSKFLEEVE